MQQARLLLLLAALASASSVRAAEDDCLAVSCMADGVECDRTAEECPPCLFYDYKEGSTMCYALTIDGECESAKYTYCEGTAAPPASDDDGGTSVTSSTGSNSTTASDATDTPAPTAAEPTLSPPPGTTDKQSAEAMNGESKSGASFPSWIIIALGLVVGVALAVFGSIVYKRRRTRLQNETAAKTPFDDGKYHGNNGDSPTRPFERTARATFDSGSHGDDFDTIASPPPAASNLRPNNSRNAKDRQSHRHHDQPNHDHYDANRGPTPAIGSRDSYSTHIPDREYAPKKKSAAAKAVPSFKPAGGGSGWGAVAPPPASPQGGRKQSRARDDSWGDASEHDAFATSDGSEWLDTNYMDLDTLRPSGDDADLYTMNSTSAGTDLYTHMADDDMMTNPRRRQEDDDDDAMYPDTSIPTSSGGNIFALESMRQRDTGTFHDDEIIDLSRREPAQPFGRKKQAKDKVAKFKSKYMAL